MRSDPARVASDGILNKVEDRISREYRNAHEEVVRKYNEYMRRFAIKDEKWQQWVKDGKRSIDDYKKWLKTQVFAGERWREMRDELATDYANAARVSRSIVQGYMPDAYAESHNYTTYAIENGTRLDTSYTLYNRQAVERIYRDNPMLYKAPGRETSLKVAMGELKAWDKQQIQSVITQGILQGESIPNLTKRLERVTGGDHRAAIRNARTMINGAENAGRQAAMERARDLGIDVKKQWLATLDSRTRHAHRQMDGVTVAVDEYFETENGRIMYPGDPSGPAEDVYNCRCTSITILPKHEIDVTDTSLRPSEALKSMSYEEWKAERNPSSDPIDKQEEIADRMREKYIKEYQRG